MLRKFWSRYRPSHSFEIEKAVAQKRVVKRIFDTLKGENDVMRKLEGLNVHLSTATVVEVVEGLPVHSAWNFFCWARGHNGFKHDKHTYLAMIQRFGSEKVSDHLKELYQDMKNDGCDPSLVTYTSLMRAHARAGKPNEALETWNILKQAGFLLNVDAYNCAIGSLLKAKRHQEALQIYREMLQAHCCPNAQTYHYLLESLVDAQKLESAYLIIKKMPRLGVRPFQPTYDMLVRANLKAGDLDTAIGLLLQMKDTSREPKRSTMVLVRKACQRAGKSTDILEQTWESYFAYANEPTSDEDGKKFSKEDDSVSAKAGGGSPTSSELEDDEDDNIDVDKGSLASILTPWGPPTVQTLKKMKFTWTTPVASYLMKDLQDVDVAFGFFEWLRSQEGFKHDETTYIKMIVLLLRPRKFPIIDCLLNEMHEQGLEVPTWLFNQIIECYSSCHDALGALEVFEKMADMGTQPNEVTFTSLIDILMREGLHQRAMEVYGQMLQAGCEPNNFTYSVLINGLGIAGKAEAGHKLLNIMLKHGYKPNVITYTALLSGYEKLGRLSNVLEVYREMQAAGIEPTPITYRVLSHAFFRAGKRDEGKRMEEKLQDLVSSTIGESVLAESRLSSCNAILKTLEDLAILDDSFSKQTC